jgi:hypothetical protein
MLLGQRCGDVTAADEHRKWRLTGADGKPYESPIPGVLGGHRRTRIYGRLDCPSALRAIARGGYVTHRVFFANEQDAVAAGYRPCARCLPHAYAKSKATIRSIEFEERLSEPDLTHRVE